MAKYAVLSAGLIAGAMQFDTVEDASAYADQQCARDRGPRAVVTVIAEARTEGKPRVEVTRFDQAEAAHA